MLKGTTLILLGNFGIYLALSGYFKSTIHNLWFVTVSIRLSDSGIVKLKIEIDFVPDASYYSEYELRQRVFSQ